MSRKGKGEERRICIVQPSADSLTETFLVAHAAYLPARVTVVHGLLHRGEMPQVGGRPVLDESLRARFRRKLKRLALRRNYWEDTEAYLEVFRRARVEAVLAEYGISGVAVAEACRVAKLPLIVHFHGFEASKQFLIEKYRERYRALFREVKGIVAVSRAMKRRLQALGAPEEKIFWNPCGVDCEKFAPGRPEAVAPVFIAVGRFVNKKAPHLTLLAFAKARQVCPEARLRWIGEGPLLEVSRDLADGLKVSDAVDFLGAQPQERVVQEMQRARAFVQHSVEAWDGDCEGTPVGILEAGASGLPVVATRHGGIPDVVIDGKTGLLVEERDVEGMAAHMARLAREPRWAGELGRAARKRVAAQHSMEHSIGRLWRIIEGAIEGCLPASAEFDPRQADIPTDNAGYQRRQVSGE